MSALSNYPSPDLTVNDDPAARNLDSHRFRSRQIHKSFEAIASWAESRQLANAAASVREFAECNESSMRARAGLIENKEYCQSKDALSSFENNFLFTYDRAQSVLATNRTEANEVLFTPLKLVRNLNDFFSSRAGSHASLGASTAAGKQHFNRFWIDLESFAPQIGFDEETGTLFTVGAFDLKSDLSLGVIRDVNKLNCMSFEESQKLDSENPA